MGDSPGDETNSPVIRVYDSAGNVIETHERAGEFKEVMTFHSYHVGVPVKTGFHDSAFIGFLPTAELKPNSR